MDARADARRVELFEHLVPARQTHLIDVPDMLVPRRHAGKGHATQRGEALGIPLGGRASLLVPAIESTELRVQHRRLKRVESRVEAHLGMVVLDVASVIAQTPHALGHVVTGGHHCASIAVGAQVLAGVEARARDITERTRGSPRLSGALALGSVLDQCEPRV